MDIKNQKRIGLAVLISLTIVVIILRFGTYFVTPEGVIEPYGDGFKAYTVIAYHAQHDSTWTYFEGMNYPYGDHIVPSACQPLVSNTIRFISRNFVDIADWTITIVNISILLSLLLGAIFLYLIFLELELPIWYAVTIAIGIIFLSPQIHRIHAHYGLAHAVVLPALLYFLLRFNHSFSLKDSISVGIITLLFPLIHFYYFAIMGATIILHFFFMFISRRDWKKIGKYALHFSIQLLIPLTFFVLWINMLDPVEDRSAFPWGFFHYIAVADGIFLSPYQPHLQWIYRSFLGGMPGFFENFEGRSYVGLVGLITIIGLLVGWIRRRFKLPYIKLDTKYDSFLNDIFFSAIILLLFSFCLPFAITGLEWLVDYFGPIKQFRSLGRFAWLFYYVINIIGFVWLFKVFKSRVILLALGVGILWFEAYNHSWSIQLDIDEVPEFKQGQRFTDIATINYEDYQAILTVPYYHIGSELFWKIPEGFILQKSLILSLQTGLPTTSAMLTRSSRSQTINQLELAGEPYRVPGLLDDLPNEKPFILIWDEQEFRKEAGKYAHLREGLRLLYEEGERLKLYELPVGKFKERVIKLQSQVRGEVENELLKAKDNFLLIDSSDLILYESFDALNTELTYQGPGAWQYPINEKDLYPLKEFEKQPDQLYALSIWMYIDVDLHARSNLKLIERSKAGVDLQIYTQHIQRHINVFDAGWGLIEFDFQPKSTDSDFFLSFENPDLRRDSLRFDELLIRKKDRNVWRKMGDKVMKNNRYY